ncbi:MAG: hypothetical protein IKF14_07775 [Atopobiaceae bacterium]|nr:hypothetical protein [Atopobiaceae bacterium]
MSQVFQQEMQGTTLLMVDQGNEWRRIFAHREHTELEVGEFTRGPLTSEVYDAPAHYHCVRLDCAGMQEGAVRLGELLGEVGQSDFELLLHGYFADEHRFLADLMDELDGWHIPYGYLNGVVGSHVSYRPRYLCPKPHSTLHLV